MDNSTNLYWQRIPESLADHAIVESITDLFDPIIDNDKNLSDRWPRPKHRARLHRTLSVLCLNAFDAYMTGASSIVDRSTLPGDGNLTDDAVTEALQLLVTRGQLTLIPGEQTEVAINPDSETGQVAARHKAEVLAHSQPMNLDTWSDHPKVDALVDEIYGEHFSSRKAAAVKKHIKVVVLDLFVRWRVDPTLWTSVSLNKSSYRAKSRYNAVGLSELTTSVVGRLADVGLVMHAPGWHSETGGRQSRIFPTPALVRLFSGAEFSLHDVAQHPEREVIVLRNASKVDIEYEDTDETNEMRARLRRYNDLMARTFVDIPTLEEPFITLKDEQKHQVNQRAKFTRRIFNRESFSKGGRFYGGWWQGCPSELRKGIFIDDKPTVELDYSNLHPMLLYALAGQSYPLELGDVYNFELPDLPEGVERRALIKSLLLVSINASGDTAAFKAFQNDAEKGSPYKRLKEATLGAVLSAFRAKHPAIAPYLAQDQGINLMRMDSEITDRILTAFTDRGIPVLSVFDSYIVQLEHARALQREMEKAFSDVSGKPHFKIEPSRALHPKNMHVFGSVPTPNQKAQVRLGQFSQPIIETSANKFLQRWAYPSQSTRYKKELRLFKDSRASL